MFQMRSLPCTALPQEGTTAKRTNPNKNLSRQSQEYLYVIEEGNMFFPKLRESPALNHLPLDECGHCPSSLWRNFVFLFSFSRI